MAQIPQKSWAVQMPATLEEVWIDYTTGLIPDPACEQEMISVVVPRNSVLEHDDCSFADREGIAKRIRDWWRRITID
jgi:hypothetical protein